MTARILAVEDSRTQREVLRAELEAAGFDVVVADSGESAVERLATEHVDLVLSDIVMPGMDGYELCRQIKAERRDLPVVLLTSLTDPLDVVHGLEAGADNFLRKPYDAEQLVARVRTILHNADLRSTGRAQMGLELYFLGQRFMITADRQQILDLLVSTFEDLVGTNREVRAREAELALAHEELARQLDAAERERQRLGAVLAAVPDAMVIVDEQGLITESSEAALRLLGTSAAELVGRPALEVTRLVDNKGVPVTGDDRPLVAALAGLESDELGGAFDLFLERSDGTQLPVMVRAAPVRDTSGRVRGAVSLVHEVGGLAGHDPVTRLPNHTLFADRVARAAALSAQQGLPTVVLVVVLDRFSRVRESVGPDGANRLLSQVAGRLQSALGSAGGRGLDSSVAHLGGEEFAVVLAHVRDEVEALRVARFLGDELAVPLSLDTLDVSLTASIGVALTRDRDSGAVHLVPAAAAAARRASAAGGNRCEVFDPSMSVRANERLQAEAELRTAIAQGQLAVHYQPELLLSTGQVVGAEALVRWLHPERGLVVPAEFIPLAEETGLVVPLGWWVLEEACRRASAWRGTLPGAQSFTVSVNVSSQQLAHPDVTKRIRSALAESGLDAGGLLLEITESGIVEDVHDAVARIQELRALGVQFRIDDFGTGYSSLVQLRRFPVNALKIDRSFVAGMTTEPEDGAIVAGTVRLAHALGLQAVAEGVEDQEQFLALRSLGCDLAQGYLWSPPLPPEGFTAWFRQEASRSRGRERFGRARDGAAADPTAYSNP